MKKIALLLFFVSLLHSEDIDILYIKNGCPNCHGFYGEGTSNGPRLQNKKEELLLRRLKDLQKDITRTSNGAIMVQFAKALDANQTREMARYLSIIKSSYEGRDLIDYGEHANGGS